MATHDYIISNASGAAVRADLNNALAAIATNNSSATEPTTTYPYQWWADTGSSPTVMKLRNAANSGWVTLFQLDGEWSLIPFENGTAAAPSIYFKDSGTDTGFYSPGADQVGITTGGAVRLTTSTTAFTGTLPWQGQNGTAAAPALSFSGDPNTGVYNVGADQLGISTGGTLRLTTSTTAITSTLPIVYPLGAVGTPSVTFTGDLNTGIWSPAADTVAASTGGTERLRITSAGAVGINTASPNLTGFTGRVATLNLPAATNGGFEIAKDGNLVAVFAVEAGTNDVRFGTTSSAATALWANNQERCRIDSSGRLLINSTTGRSNFYNASTISGLLQVEGTTDLTRATSLVHNTANSSGPLFILAKSRGATVGSNTVVQNGDQLGEITFQGSDGTEFVSGAFIRGFVDGTPGANDMPVGLAIGTCADGASDPSERMRIAQDGAVFIGKAVSNISTAGVEFFGGANLGAVFMTRNNSDILSINRQTSDGNLVLFYQDGTTEGSISVSGTTVSYNGAHLSRWSQILGIDPHDKTDRPEILRGTVMSNLDEMCNWIDPQSGEEQDNEQLNKTKVSNVVGDKNVAGVFQAWDDDDETWVNDYYLAMTGDFIIRIAEGVTVERGDLLMSAGDGTAKPQDDDAVRSCTIAKVTSAHVSHTYDDGSYCVPCVLMSC